jgi:hypothetical protein
MVLKKPSAYLDLIKWIEPSERLKIISLDPYVAEGRLAMPYRYFPGPVATRFFLALRDEARILGIRCPQCRMVYVPPEPTCGRCFSKLEEWVEVGKEGILQGYTITHYSLPVHPAPAPVIYGLIRLDRADTALLHLLGQVDADDLKIGMRVEAVFRMERRGNILDIEHFRPFQKTAHT